MISYSTSTRIKQLFLLSTLFLTGCIAETTNPSGSVEYNGVGWIKTEIGLSFAGRLKDVTDYTLSILGEELKPGACMEVDYYSNYESKVVSAKGKLCK